MGMDTSTSSFAMIHLGVILDNGLLKLKLSTPAGMIVAIHYNGTPNLLESGLKESQRGFVVVLEIKADHFSFDPPISNEQHNRRIHGTSFDLISKDENHIEVSFLKTWKYDNKDDPPIKVDKRYVMLRGCSGFYSYAIYQHLEEWPDIDIEQTRLAFKLDKTL
ncbi:Rhamnogalacturonate lyase [Cynara cardunculus var. scolymus]|uniref:Rhamnogalacturonate lyase n=1 Tax=Cynara cardunculus var. scolymus TaxID=59895 RepID=A0A103YGD8_CYNCS|nr:Rhamnogalacturonate lyase [Cynara cardunculus var. scolymus]